MVGIPRSTATRAESVPTRRARSVPANKLTPAERTHILRVANSPEFVDLPSIQIDAELLDSGVYLASISTIYRVLAEIGRSKNAAGWHGIQRGRFQS